MVGLDTAEVKLTGKASLKASGATKDSHIYILTNIELIGVLTKMVERMLQTLPLNIA